jgi:hypothetical protein
MGGALRIIGSDRVTLAGHDQSFQHTAGATASTRDGLIHR